MIQELSPVIFVEGEFSKDVCTVSQYGYIDMRAAMATGVVPSQLADSQVPDNGIEDPNAIIGRPDDVFSAKRAADAYNSAKAASASSEVSPETGKDA